MQSPRRNARGLVGGGRGVQILKEILKMVPHAPAPVAKDDRAGGFNRSAHSAGPFCYDVWLFGCLVRCTWVLEACGGVLQLVGT